MVVEWTKCDSWYLATLTNKGAVEKGTRLCRATFPNGIAPPWALKKIDQIRTQAEEDEAMKRSGPANKRATADAGEKKKSEQGKKSKRE